MTDDGEVPADVLRPYVPHLLVEWLQDGGLGTWREVEGTLAFVDISGFTRLTERLARRGRVGAEEMNDVLDSTFVRLLDAVAGEGGDLLKWGGDAVLLLFRGAGHAERACRAATGMQAALRRIGPIRTAAGTATLRMSAGIHSGSFHLFLVGGRHRELLITGPAATRTAEAEAAAVAGQVVVSDATAALLPPRLLGGACGPGRLLRAVPPPVAVPEPSAGGPPVDLTQCLAEPVRRHLLQDAGSAEHRRISVAFLQFSGVDGLLRRAGPDAVAARLAALVGAVQDAAHQEGVTFLESDIAVDGGKILLLAGAPASEGDDEERMLRTVRAALDAESGLPLRAGVHAGAVFAGGFGPSYRRTYSVKGDAVNLAARLAGKAGTGELLATAAVVKPSRTPFAIRPLPPFAVKGKSAPIEAFAVAEQVSATARGAVSGPLVGRDAELEVLRRALAAARAGSGRLVQLVGEPGIGKSRLVAELVDDAAGCRVLIVNCERYDAATPYAGAAEILAQVLGTAAADPEGAEAVALLRRRVAELLPDAVPWVPLVAVVLGLDVEDTPEVAALEQRFRKELLQNTVRDLILRAVAGPAVLVVDDAHWLDQASTDLLAHLAAALRDRPWLVLVTRRDREGGFGASDVLEPVELRPSPLPPDVAEALVVAATEDAPLPPHAVAELARRAGGNPLFLTELLAAARVGGAGEALPESIEAVLTAQIDRLAPLDRLVLRRAAVLGSTFDEDLLAAITDEGAAAPDAATWDRLAGFVEVGRRGERRFRHGLIRNAAYEGLPYRLRRELHARAGAAIERLAGGDDDAELRSLHYFHAGRFADAWPLARQAAQRAAEVYANADAALLYERALAAAREVGDVPPAELAAVHEAIGDVRVLLGEFAAAGDAFARARRLLGQHEVAQARLLLKHARIPERLGRWSEALAWTRRGLRMLDGASGCEAACQRAQLLVWRAAILQAQGRHAEAVRWCERAIAEAESSGARDALAHAYFLLDWAYVDLGRLDEATHSRLALEIYEELGDLGRQASLYNNLGAWAYYRGDWDEALEMYERGRATRARTGDAVNAAFGTCNVGEILSDQGRLAEAEPRFREARRVWWAAGDRPGVAFVVSALGRLATRAGRPDEALALLAEARATFVHVGARADVVDADARVAECYALHGRPADALALADEGLGRARSLAEEQAQVPLLERVRGWSLAQLGDRVAAFDAFGASLAAAQRRKAEFEVAVTLDAMARTPGLLHGDAIAACREDADAIMRRLGVVLLPAPAATELARGARGGVRAGA